MKVIQKYFLALVPPESIIEKVQEMKFLIRDQFGVKYALKSPPHITVKMPFNYNEAKEGRLIEKLNEYLKDRRPFPIQVSGVGNFGKRVVYLNILKSPQLENFQEGIKHFCKRELHLVDELSDRNYHPHMTVAFKDIKPIHFSEVLLLVKKLSFETEFSALDLVLLKRINGEWVLFRKIKFGA
ncbi:2'-5' RNA ligase family protein [Algoriphagus sp.]|jgi:2'-5' RNA ligase|uniref:2'-5' RNA ligase family protein n=1 Tax=Algoriphagus sp. TaxID=1872435 RepID=UPI002723E099|nr:2'-5' RNA ligase family protein [Algoriphagus sp.]MDO8966432.1 2'-5' RNA ligase family protein [Algoriphagus sp.]MDP3201878.1 2'-5' RNA ligase family protein [Algoriphagus sp.]